MSNNTFYNFIDLLKDELAIDELQSVWSTQGADPAISPEVTVAARSRLV